MEIYYKSDFSLVEIFLNAEGVVVDPRTLEFVLIYKTSTQETFTASHLNDVYTNCSYNEEENGINVYFGNHNLKAGILTRELTIYQTDTEYPDDTKKLISLLDCDVELVCSGGDGSGYTEEQILLAIGATGATGATGNGIVSVSKTNTTLLTDTYTILYTNSTTSTFNIVNGKGIVSILKTGTLGLIDTYTITYNDETTSTFFVTNGEQGIQGETGIGISSIAKTSTLGLVDTYTITFTNGTTTTFSVTNGNTNNAYVANSLLYMDKISTFGNSGVSGVTYIDAVKFGNFLKDIKVFGIAETGYTYGISAINYHNGDGTAYSYYIAFSKYNSSGTATLIYALYLYTPSDLNEIIETEMTAIGSSQGTVTGVRIAYNFAALEGITNMGHSYINPTYGWIFNQVYLFDLTSNYGYFAEKTTLENYVDEAIAIPAAGINMLSFPQEIIAWQLANDTYTGGYGYKNLGQYTKKMTEATAFSAIQLNQVKSANAAITYKIYKVSLSSWGARECPIGIISSSTHILLQEGSLTITSSYADYTIELEKIITLDINEQVVIYLVSDTSTPISISGAAGTVGNTDKTTNVALLNVNSDPWATAWGAGSVNESTNIGYFNMALTLLEIPIYASSTEMETQITDILDVEIPIRVNLELNKLEITIPDVIYAVVGQELNLWNDSISLSIDKGLFSPQNYKCEWYSLVGLVTDRCFRFTPILAQAGNSYSVTCYIYNFNYELITSKTFTITVIAATGLTTAKNIVYFGDSLNSGGQMTSPLLANFTALGGTDPVLLGTNGTAPNKYEAIGGYRFADYATAGRKAYRCYVTGITSISIGATYSNNSFVWTIIEVNISGGSGNILVTKYDTTSSTDSITLTSGTLILVSGSGDASIPYTGAYLVGANPLWNEATAQLDIDLYKTRIGLSSSDVIDAVCFQFGINDNTLADDLPTLATYISNLYNLFINDNANCVVILGMTTSAGNTQDGSGANYGAANYIKSYLENIYMLHQTYLSSYQGNVSYPNLHIAPIGLMVDRYYGYAFASRTISARYTTMENYHSNFVHPATSGYEQMADAYFPILLYLLT